MVNSNVLQRLYQLLTQGNSICTDSRQATAGAIFFALKGNNYNGNHFAIKALENGCVASVVDEPAGVNNDQIILVENVLETLQQLSLYNRKKFNLPVLGITGSNGKTTTKELVFAVLNTTFNTLATQGNLNNHIGVPLTLLRLNGSHQMAIIEMGANHVGEIELLSGLACPDYGLITNIGKAHLEGFGSLENILKGKTELYNHVSNENGLLFVNGDNQQLTGKATGISHILYGRKETFHCSARITGQNPFLSLEFMVNKPFGKANKGITGNI
ncbi:MAG TPA: UDP-N-acetylmuramoyl-tripeptide--D-alanyl-D-alanine ligase, partial [Bacteroidales bacterium]|nr:UDP-N-acetylmuramoyl-tripeptide--D-alanyl-D-alanine ligase [Bacteroidales bacterium]